MHGKLSYDGLKPGSVKDDGGKAVHTPVPEPPQYCAYVPVMAKKEKNKKSRVSFFIVGV